jgi:hypothetical protein
MSLSYFLILYTDDDDDDESPGGVFFFFPGHTFKHAHFHYERVCVYRHNRGSPRESLFFFWLNSTSCREYIFPR